MGHIRFDGVSKIFHRHTGQKLIRHHFRDWFRGRPEQDFYALKNVSFHIDEGERVAEVSGRIAALLELGSGFHPDLTGAENVYLNASLLGFTRARAKALFDSIVEFSGVGRSE